MLLQFRRKCKKHPVHHEFEWDKRLLYDLYVFI